MEIKSIINIILKDLEETRNLIDDFKNYPGVPIIQIELAKEKCRSAENVIGLLLDMEKELAIETKAEEIIVEEATLKGEPNEIISEAAKPVQETKEKEIIEQTPDHKERTEKRMKVVDEIVSYDHSEKPNKSVEKEKKIVADSFSHLSSRINEKLGDQDQKTKITRPVTNLNSAIGLNDRYLFIREIFDGNKENFTKIISEIESLGSFDEAIDIIRSNTKSDIESEPVQQLIEIVKRKFTL